MKRSVLLWAALPLLLAGCLSVGSGASGASSEGPMDQFRLGRLFERQVEKVDGGAGYMRSQVDGIDVFLISDPETDRVQLILSIPMSANITAQDLVQMLEANFHHGLDARYALSEGRIFAVFSHRLSTLDEDDFVAGYRQALDLARRFASLSEGRTPGTVR
ncbi:MAG: hypothetical protein AAGC67_04970 [Myxococcota bacterium]